MVVYLFDLRNHISFYIDSCIHLFLIYLFCQGKCLTFFFYSVLETRGCSFRKHEVLTFAQLNSLRHCGYQSIFPTPLGFA